MIATFDSEARCIVRVRLRPSLARTNLQRAGVGAPRTALHSA